MCVKHRAIKPAKPMSLHLVKNGRFIIELIIPMIKNMTLKKPIVEGASINITKPRLPGLDCTMK